MPNEIRRRTPVKAPAKSQSTTHAVIAPRPTGRGVPPQGTPSGKGIDVSQWQGVINWQQVKQAGGVSWAYIKASEGSGHIDPKYASNVSGAKQAGVRVGAYHYYRPNVNPMQQAALFINQIKASGATDLAPAIDVEEPMPGQAPAAYAANLATMLAAVKAGIGQTPVIYTSPGFWGSYVKDQKLAQQYPLWLAQWGESMTPPAGFSAPVAWQYSAKGRVPGISNDVDLDSGLGGAYKPNDLAPTGAAPQPAIIGQAVPNALPQAAGVAAGVASGLAYQAGLQPAAIPTVIPQAKAAVAGAAAGLASQVGVKPQPAGETIPLVTTPLGEIGIPKGTAISTGAIIGGVLLVLVGLIWFASRGGQFLGAKLGTENLARQKEDFGKAMQIGKRALAGEGG